MENTEFFTSCCYIIWLNPYDKLEKEQLRGRNEQRGQMMNKDTEKQLARSLTGETVELLPYMPYLLKDFWELGSDPELMIGLIGRHLEITDTTGILDLGCGKGAVAVKAAREFGVRVKGIDLMFEFIEFAKGKAVEYKVSDLCDFAVGDINDAAETETGYDCVIFGAVGPDALGGPSSALDKLKHTVKPDGFILIEEAFIPEGCDREQVKYNSDAYITEKEWMDLFKEKDLKLVDIASSDNFDDINYNEIGLNQIITRANELIAKYPNEKEMFESYIQSQRNEYEDIDDNLTCVTWMLKKCSLTDAKTLTRPTTLLYNTSNNKNA